MYRCSPRSLNADQCHVLTYALLGDKDEPWRNCYHRETDNCTVPEQLVSMGLMRLYDEAFGRSGTRVAQVLLTYLDLDSRSLHGNIQRSVEHMLAHKGVVPIFNENDVVSYDELVGARFGDNDQLSAHVAILARAERLIILSNIRGLATNPDGTGRLIRDVRGITPRIQKLAGGTQSQTSVGGMISKFKAARLVNAAGIPMQIANGRQKNVLVSICHGEAVGTIFHP